MCGGDLNITEGVTVAECEYCGTRQTVPNADSEKKTSLFLRAEKLRRDCDFDRAAAIYDAIVTEFPAEPEAWWGLVLCQYGIEYVDDPASGKKIPTCHRSSFTPVMEDGNLGRALDCADSVARKVYREEARAIEAIRKGILEVSQQEAPYDVFICYKETDDKGERTEDSVLAQEVYDVLTEKGYRVFFSRITLEDKLGTEYEPYIFAALNSARVMLVFGTDCEYLDAVWVKNEWSRFLKLMAQDKNKHLIPCYKGLDAYDLPREFQKLQGQDLGKVGAVQDLLRGIDKLLSKGSAAQAAPAPAAPAAGPTVESLLKRGQMLLEDGEWKRAGACFDQVLDLDPECAQAYVGKLCGERQYRRIAEMAADPSAYQMLTGDSPQVDARRSRQPAGSGKLPASVKLYRSQTGADLRTAREAVEELADDPDAHEPDGGAKRAAAYFERALRFGPQALREQLEGYREGAERAYREEQRQEELRARERARAEQAHEALRAERTRQAGLVGTRLAAVSNTTFGVKADGTVLAAGSWENGAEGWTEIVALAAGPFHLVGLRSDGTVVAANCMGCDDGACEVEGWSNITAVAAGTDFTLGLKGDGTVVAVGQNDNGQCDVEQWTDITAVAAGNNFSLGLRSDGTVLAAARGQSYISLQKLSKWTDITALSANGDTAAGVKRDGTVELTGGSAIPGSLVALRSWQDIAAVSVGRTHLVGLKTDGTVLAVGREDSGQCEVSGWKFYGFPILRIGAVYLAVQTVLSLLFMALGALVPVWIPLVIYVVLLGGGALGFIGADAAREEVERQEERVIRDTSAMQGLRARSAALAGACPPALAGPVGKLADDLRFSDPVSSPATASLEGELGALLDRLEGAVAAGDGEQVQDLCRQAGQLLDQRNRLCKLNK